MMMYDLDTCVNVGASNHKIQRSQLSGFMEDSKSAVIEAESDGSPVFLPPLDYKRVKHLKKFHKKNGEQLWLIKLPKGLDLTKLKTLPSEINTEEQPLSVEREDDDGDNIQYNISEDKTQTGVRDSSNLSLLIPEESKEFLKISGHGTSLKFDKILNVRRAIEIPKIDYEKLIAPRSNAVELESLQTTYHTSVYEQGGIDRANNSKEEHSEKKLKKHKKHSTDEGGHLKKKSKRERKK